jgi:hypothetical protein
MNRLITYLWGQHAAHDTPELMQCWTFNRTAPFTDWRLGTTYRGPLPR